jgi:hypothetical protein
MRKRHLVVVMLLAPVWAGCTGRKSASTPLAPSQTTTSVPIAAVTALAIGGIAPFTRIGETAQLRVTATLSDGTTKDVTSVGAWRWGDSRIVTVSPGGLVTVSGFGATWVSCVYQMKGASGTLTATPAGTFVIRGRVREPAAGSVVGVNVVETITGRSATTDIDGEFSIAELARQQGRFKLEKDGYEPADVETTTAYVDLPLARIVRLTAGGAVTPGPLAPNDLVYTVAGKTCSSCRLIRILVPRAGMLHLHVTWTGAARLSLFADGQVVTGDARELTADVAINASGEVIVYLGVASSTSLGEHTTFTLETSLR